MILIILMMVLVVDDYVSDLANINFAAVHSIQSFDLLVKQNLVKYLKPRQFSTDIIATLKIWSMLPVRSPSISPFCFLVSALKWEKKLFFFFLFFTTMFRWKTELGSEMVLMTIINKNLGPLTLVWSRAELVSLLPLTRRPLTYERGGWLTTKLLHLHIMLIMTPARWMENV